jgi:hypothetical protein
MPAMSRPGPDAAPPPVDAAAAPPLVVGWKEYLDLPELGIARLKAKVDTGARTSALHVSGVRLLAEHADGSGEIELTVPLSRRHPARTVTARAHMLRRVRVTDSGGASELRPVIETELVLGPVRKRILLTLTDRAGMLFRMLIGRKALEGDFLVDVSRRYALRAWHPGPRRRPAAAP